MKRKKHLFTVLLLAISLLSTSIPVYAHENGNADNENSTSEESNPSTTDFSLMRHDRDREMIYTPQMIDIYHLLKKY